MAAENVTWTINRVPQDTLLGLGNGSLINGIRKAAGLATNLKKAFTNMWFGVGTDTVGADTNFDVEIDVKTPVLITSIQYDNNTSATGVLTSIKVDGNVAVPQSALSTTAQQMLISDLFAEDSDWIFIVPAGVTLGFHGTTCVNGDVVTICVTGYDLTLRAVD